MNPLLTVPEVAEILRCSDRFVKDELRRKNLRGAVIGGAWKVSQVDLDIYREAKANVRAVRRVS